MVELERIELSTSSMPRPLTGTIRKDHPSPHQVMSSYLSYLETRALSTNYINANRQYLTRFVNTCEHLSPDSASKFLSKSNHLSINSRIRYAGYLKGLLEFHGMRFDVKIKRPRILPELVAEADIEKLKEVIRNHKSHKWSIHRDLLLIDVAAKTGMRRAEMAKLKVADIDFTRRRIKVVSGKGRKDRVIPLSANLTQSLLTHCADKHDVDTVFGLNYRSLGMKIKEWAKKAGVNLHTHSFRHYFATTLVERGANIRVVQELLGHSSLATTQVYLSVTANHLEEAIELLD